MQRRSVIATVGAVLGTSVGAAAYTSATIERDATFTVETDSDALIGLAAGSTDGITEESDKLTINVGDDNGMNTDGDFTFGDEEDLSTYAFSITNNDDETRSIDVDYDNGDTGQVEFKIYEEDTEWPDASLVGTASDDTTVELSAGSSQEFRVVMTVNTDGIGSGSEDLDGTLTFTATPETAE